MLQKVQEVLIKLHEKDPDLYQYPFSKENWMHLIDAGIIMSCIPVENGGRLSTATTFNLLAKLSYFALPLSLRVMIIQLLFAATLVKHANSRTKSEIFPRLMSGDIGGIAITEPAHGSDALKMETHYCTNSQGYTISGVKHWQGLSGEADWFLIAARKMEENKKPSGNVDLFLHDIRLGGMEMIERYYTPGLLMMQYGKNQINVNVPRHRKMDFPLGKRNPLIMDVFNTARLAFPAMGLGFLERIYEDAKKYTGSRQVNRHCLSEYDLVKFRLETLEMWRNLCFLLFEHSIINVDVYQSVADKTLLANVYKVVVSELMLKASHSLQQIYGGMGYRRYGFPERAFADSRPFQILDGSNDILFAQIASFVMKKKYASKVIQFSEFLEEFDFTRMAGKSVFESLSTIKVDFRIPQRKLWYLGNILARVITLSCLKEVQQYNVLAEIYIHDIETFLKTEIHQFTFELNLIS